MKTSTHLTSPLFHTLPNSSWLLFFFYPNWISCLTVKSLSHQHFQFLDFFIPSFHCFGFDFQEADCEELSANSLLRRWFWEVRVKAWRSETEKGRKPLQGVFRSRLLLEATKAQFNCEPLGSCEKHVSELPSTRDKAHKVFTHQYPRVMGWGLLWGELLLEFLSSLLTEGQAFLHS